jgi:hypothetical protein
VRLGERLSRVIATGQTIERLFTCKGKQHGIRTQWEGLVHITCSGRGSYASGGAHTHHTQWEGLSERVLNSQWEGLIYDGRGLHALRKEV